MAVAQLQKINVESFWSDISIGDYVEVQSRSGLEIGLNLGRFGENLSRWLREPDIVTNEGYVTSLTPHYFELHRKTPSELYNGAPVGISGPIRIQYNNVLAYKKIDPSNL